MYVSLLEWRTRQRCNRRKTRFQPSKIYVSRQDLRPRSSRVAIVMPRIDLAYSTYHAPFHHLFASLLSTPNTIAAQPSPRFPSLPLVDLVTYSYGSHLADPARASPGLSDGKV
ncbi:hypothetical protein RRG08_032125 [Elysia crispata]|uniref:Uncharacterized protein n=1 Tax=Elysia crispata TaxID=231223 RepID=A0AAE0ZDU1_9GAST|nr:hypothetical protein RRG08_032125 [Elysia crispata]